MPWDRLDRFADRNVFQTREWLSFLAETQKATPLVAELLDDSEVIGYFSGLTFSRFGVKILGSSFPGWTTPYIGFNLLPDVPRKAAMEALERFAFDDLKCLHLEVCDRQFRPGDGAAFGFEFDYFESFETDLTLPEDEIFAKFDKTERWAVRKAERSGVRIEEARDLAFADEYYEQLKDVFAKQGLVPTYPAGRVRSLIAHLLPAGNVLLLRAFAPDGQCIATGIYPGMNEVADLWGNASFRSGHKFSPNQALHWHAMRYWKRRGMRTFDWGGGGDYKRKYGPKPIAIPRFRKSRVKALDALRSEARRLFYAKQRLLGRLKRAKRDVT